MPLRFRRSVTIRPTKPHWSSSWRLERRRAEIEQRRKTRQGKAARGKDGPQRAGEGARFAGRRHRRPADPIDDIKAADEEEFQVLRPAIAETTRRLDDMHGDLSLAACQKVQPQYATTLRAALQAMIDDNAALEAAGAVRPMLRARGYSVLDTQLPSENRCLIGAPDHERTRGGDNIACVKDVPI